MCTYHDISHIAANQDGVGGLPSVNIVTSSNPTRSNLELDIALKWSIHEALSLGIDLEEILAGVDSSGEISQFVKGLVTFDGGALTEIDGSISFTLGVGLEYSRERKTKIVPYIKGNTGLVLKFSLETVFQFACTIGPFGADVTGNVIVDNLGKDLSISFGLNENLNYYFSSNTTIARDGFVTVPTIGNLIDQFKVAIAGRVEGQLSAKLRVPRPMSAYAHIRFGISDINLLLDPKKRNSAFAIFYEVEVSLDIPSFIGEYMYFVILLSRLLYQRPQPYIITCITRHFADGS